MRKRYFITDCIYCLLNYKYQYIIMHYIYISIFKEHKQFLQILHIVQRLMITKTGCYGQIAGLYHLPVDVGQIFII